MESINDFLASAAGWVWGLPLVCLLIGSGIYYSVCLGGIQWRGFTHALHVVRGDYNDAHDPGQLSHFRALSTALSATLGLGNIAGVAVAIHIGGPGATFWMLAAGVIGMATKFVECTLAVKYRKVDARGVVHGGPMYYIEQGLGLKWKPMAVFFALCTIFGAYGSANMFQTNQVAAIMNSSYGVPAWFTGVLLAVMTAVVIIGGIERIGHVACMLVPFTSGLYFLGSVVVIAANYKSFPSMFSTVFMDAFTGTAAVGGFAGVTMKNSLIQGIRRATFSNEAGLGSAPIAHATAVTHEPVREGIVALLEPFIDTVVICTLTALVIVSSGAWTQDVSGVQLTALAFDSVIPGFGRYFVPLAVFLFAFATLISWSYYGERASDYLWGEKAILPYKVVYCVLAALGAIWAIEPVLNFSDIMLGLMAIPNSIACLLLFPEVRRDTQTYFEKLGRGEFKPKAGVKTSTPQTVG